jgi:hypothetical protein
MYYQAFMGIPPLIVTGRLLAVGTINFMYGKDLLSSCANPLMPNHNQDTWSAYLNWFLVSVFTIDVFKCICKCRYFPFQSPLVHIYRCAHIHMYRCNLPSPESPSPCIKTIEAECLPSSGWIVIVPVWPSVSILMVRIYLLVLAPKLVSLRLGLRWCLRRKFDTINKDLIIQYDECNQLPLVYQSDFINVN